MSSFLMSLAVAVILYLAKNVLVEARITEESLQSYEEINLTTAELLELRGFSAINHQVVISSGYILNLVRCTNPLIKNATRQVVLFVHGTSSNANYFILNSLGAHPKDLSGLDIEGKSEQELEELFMNDPNKNSFPLLLLNTGHEVWFLNRRGTSQSLGHIDPNKQPYTMPVGDITKNLTSSDSSMDGNVSAQLNVSDSIMSTLEKSVNPLYWNYTMDDEVSIDLPQIIDYILSATKRQKLAYVGHSIGSALLLAGMSTMRELNDKVSVALLWGPSIYKKVPDGQLNETLSKVQDLKSYIGPNPITAELPAMRQHLADTCKTVEDQQTTCASMYDKMYGYGGQQQTLLPGFVSGFRDTSTSPELLQNQQTYLKGKLHYFDYDEESENMKAYGQPEPPVYDVSRITNSKLTLWGGSTDIVAPIDRVEQLIEDMTVEPAKVVFINQTGIFFNHNSFVFHEHVAELLNIPSLKTLITLGGEQQVTV